MSIADTFSDEYKNQYCKYCNNLMARSPQKKTQSGHVVRLVWILIVACIVFGTNAFGAVTINIYQSGADVVVDASGSMKVPPPESNASTFASSITPRSPGGNITFGGSLIRSAQGMICVRAGGNPVTFGVGNIQVSATSGSVSFPLLFNVANTGVFWRPSSATTGAIISNISNYTTYANQTFTSLGITPGIYITCTYGNASSDETFYISTGEAVPTASPVSATIPHNSTGTNVTLSATGPPTSVSVVTQPLNGTAVVSGISIIYTPTTGYSGPDSFQYTASNALGTSSPANVSITVSPPNANLSALTLSSGAFSPAFSANVTSYTASVANNVSTVTIRPTAALTSSTITVNGTAVSSGSSTGAISLNVGSNVITTLVTAENGTTTKTYTITVTRAAAATPTAAQAIASKILTNGVAATSFTPVTGSGGTGALAYTISPALPSGLSISSSTGAITGTPSVTSSNTTYTVTVTDANSSTATATFSLSVVNPPAATQAVASNVLTVGVAASSFTPVTGSNGAGALTYTISPALPSGLSIAPSTGAITGTPSATSGNATYTVTVTDANSLTANATFSLTVASAPTATLAIASQALTNGVVATPFTPVVGSGGAGSLAYTISPALPSGLSISSGTGGITGTPTVSLSATSYTVTISDQNGAVAASTFSLTVNGPLTASQAVVSRVLPVGIAAQTFTPVIGGGGTGPLVYTISPLLPSGLSIASSTGAITGTPASASASTSYTVTVTDANSATAQAAFSLITALPPTAAQAVPSKTIANGSVAASFTPVTGSGGTGALAYTISPALPSGLSISLSTGAITGTPSAASSSTTYTVTVTDANNLTAAATFSLTVAAPPTATQAIASKALTVGVAATSFIPVTGSNGSGALTYTISPALPAGLLIAASTGEITGTPSVTSSSTTYTVTVTDASSLTAAATFSLTVTLRTQATLVLSASPTSLNSTSRTSTLSTSGGEGSGAVSYSTTAGSCTISGNVVSAGSVAETCTVTATKASDGIFLAATASVNIAVSLRTPIASAATDASVLAVHTAQVMQSKIFVTAQVDNIKRHLDSYRKNFILKPSNINFGFNLPSLGPASQAIYKIKDELTRQPESPKDEAMPRPPTQKGDSVYRNEKKSRVFTTDSGFLKLEDVEDQGGEASNKNLSDKKLGGTVPADDNKPQEENGKESPTLMSNNNAEFDDLRYSIWTAGTIDFGSYKSGDNGETQNRLTSNGLTMGIDYKLNDSAIIGGAVGLGVASQNAAAISTSLKAKQTAFTGYGMFRLPDHWFIDALFGYGVLDFSGNRTTSDGAAQLGVDRKGETYFSSGTLSRTYWVDAYMLTTFLRQDVMRINLHSYAETGASDHALGFDGTNFIHSMTSSGVQMSRDLFFGGAKLTPSAKMALNRMRTGGLVQNIFYADTGSAGGVYAMSQAGSYMNTVSLSLGLLYTTNSGDSFEFAWQGATGDAGANQYRMNGLRFAVRIPM